MASASVRFFKRIEHQTETGPHQVTSLARSLNTKVEDTTSMSTHQTTVTKQDVYQRVTDAIVNAIETGSGQYRMPWTVRQDRGFSPVSVGSAKPYRGINTLVLWAQ